MRRGRIRTEAMPIRTRKRMKIDIMITPTRNKERILVFGFGDGGGGGGGSPVIRSLLVGGIEKIKILFFSFSFSGFSRVIFFLTEFNVKS